MVVMERLELASFWDRAEAYDAATQLVDRKKDTFWPITRSSNLFTGNPGCVPDEVAFSPRVGESSVVKVDDSSINQSEVLLQRSWWEADLVMPGSGIDTHDLFLRCKVEEVNRERDHRFSAIPDGHILRGANREEIPDLKIGRDDLTILHIEGEVGVLIGLVRSVDADKPADVVRGEVLKSPDDILVGFRRPLRLIAATNSDDDQQHQKQGSPQRLPPLEAEYSRFRKPVTTFQYNILSFNINNVNNKSNFFIRIYQPLADKKLQKKTATCFVKTTLQGGQATVLGRVWRGCELTTVRRVRLLPLLGPAVGRRLLQRGWISGGLYSPCIFSRSDAVRRDLPRCQLLQQSG